MDEKKVTLFLPITSIVATAGVLVHLTQRLNDLEENLERVSKQNYKLKKIVDNMKYNSMVMKKRKFPKNKKTRKKNRKTNTTFSENSENDDNIQSSFDSDSSSVSSIDINF